MTVQLHRFAGNPILGPRAESPWESRACFNPGALAQDGVVHLLYRAIGYDDDAYVSRLGHATSADCRRRRTGGRGPRESHRCRTWPRGGRRPS